MALHAARIPKSKSTNHFLKTKHVLYIREMAGTSATFCELAEYGFAEGLSTQDAWHLVGSKLQFSLGVAFFRKLAALLDGNSYKILRRFAEYESNEEVAVDGLEKPAGVAELSFN